MKFIGNDPTFKGTIRKLRNDEKVTPLLPLNLRGITQKDPLLNLGRDN
jgi:hypothetical protein